MMTLSSLTNTLSSSISRKLDSARSVVASKLDSAKEGAATVKSSVADTFERTAPSDWSAGISTGAGKGAEPRAPRQAVTTHAKPDASVRGLDPKRTYEKHGDQKYDLTSPEQVKQLISSSPQLDNLDKTQYDAVRCGGAAMLNGMLLSGNASKNAGAIEKTAAQSGVALSSDERSALSAMKRGEMTPKQAAVTQELLVKLGTAGGARMPNGHVRYTDAGLTPVGMAELGAKLRKNGGFADAKQVGFHSERQPDGSNHWTVSVRAKDDVITTADSWPGSDGYARVGVSDKTTRRDVGGAPNPAFRGEVRLENGANDRVSYEVTGRVTGSDGSDTGRYEKYSKTAGANEAPTFDTYSRSVHLRSTGERL